MCLVQDAAAYWAHVGDSRVYQLRQSRVLERTRDHSHVEVLLREGLITEAEVQGHPMRNYVECCLGGDAALPEMSISARRRLKAGDVLLLCTDGMWANLQDQDFVRFAQTPAKSLRDCLTDLGHAGRCRFRALQRQHQRGRAALQGRMSVRPSGRAPDELRPLSFVRGYTAHAEGSVLVQRGDTRVVCTASLEERVPPFLRGRGRDG